MNRILRVENNITVKPVVCESSPFKFTSVPTDIFTERGKRVARYSYSKAYEQIRPGEKFYSLHSWNRYVTVYLYDNKYFAVVDDGILYCYPDINGYHSRTSKEVSVRDELVFCGEEMPAEALFELEIVLY